MFAWLFCCCKSFSWDGYYTVTDEVVMCKRRRQNSSQLQSKLSSFFYVINAQLRSTSKTHSCRLMIWFVVVVIWFFCSVNFKEPEAVRALTCTLLKEDFGLTIEIPLERLIPTVPLRLNYIHWVEDLTDGQKQPRRGIDIGTSTPT